MRRMMAHFKKEEPCNALTERHFTYIARFFQTDLKKVTKLPK